MSILQYKPMGILIISKMIEKVHLDDLDLYVITFIALATTSG